MSLKSKLTARTVPDSSVEISTTLVGSTDPVAVTVTVTSPRSMAWVTYCGARWAPVPGHHNHRPPAASTRLVPMMTGQSHFRFDADWPSMASISAVLFGTRQLLSQTGAGVSPIIRHPRSDRRQDIDVGQLPDPASTPSQISAAV